MAPRRIRPLALPDGPLTLGWRWVPGAVCTYRFVTSRESGGSLSSRAEQWSYLVRDVDSEGVATLEGRLVAFGGGGQEPPTHRPTTLRLGMDGRLGGLDAGDFADTLPPRMLALRLPSVPIDRSEEWPLPDLMHTFRDLMPVALEVESRATGRLLEVHATEDGVVAEVETTGWVRSPGGPAFHLSGRARWDVQRGELVSRDLQARFTPSPPDPARDPGVLRVQLTRV